MIGSRIRAIIVNYRTTDLTIAAASSVLDDEDNVELVVVDNASGDGAVERFRDGFGDAIRVVAADENLGFGGGVNLGAANSSRDLLFILNSDATVRPGALAALATAVDADPGVAIVAPTVFTSAGTVQADSFGRFPTLRTMISRSNLSPMETPTPDWVSGVALMVRREAFESIAGFDPDYWMYFEDIDLCRRIRAAGWRITRIGGAVVDHLGGASETVSARKTAQYAASQRRYLKKVGYPAVVIRSVSALRRPLEMRRAATR